MLSQLQWEVSQAQWSDLHGDYTFGLDTEAVTGPITNIIVLGSAHWQHTSNIFDARSIGNTTVQSSRGCDTSKNSGADVEYVRRFMPI